VERGTGGFEKELLDAEKIVDEPGHPRVDRHGHRLLAENLDQIATGARSVELYEEHPLLVAEDHPALDHGDALRGLADHGVKDVSRGVCGFVLDEVLRADREIVVGVVAVLGLDAIERRLQGIGDLGAARPDDDATRRVGGEHENAPVAHTGSSNGVLDLLRNIEGIEATPGLDLELSAKDHPVIVA
jgi:hypothetical protein